MSTSAAGMSSSAIAPDQLLRHWQGHRRLTRRVIDSFPESDLFSFSIGGMRPFGALAVEIIGMSVPMVRGVVTGSWDSSSQASPQTKEETLRLWDESAERLEVLWPQVPPERFQERVTAFGMYEGPLYVIDNEIHHRGQGYVYLRARGIEPSSFPDRG